MPIAAAALGLVGTAVIFGTGVVIALELDRHLIRFLRRRRAR
jgi:hypothetical protein